MLARELSALSPKTPCKIPVVAHEAHAGLIRPRAGYLPARTPPPLLHFGTSRSATLSLMGDWGHEAGSSSETARVCVCKCGGARCCPARDGGHHPCQSRGKHSGGRQCCLGRRHHRHCSRHLHGKRHDQQGAHVPGCEFRRVRKCHARRREHDQRRLHGCVKQHHDRWPAIQWRRLCRQRRVGSERL